MLLRNGSLYVIFDLLLFNQNFIMVIWEFRGEFEDTYINQNIKTVHNAENDAKLVPEIAYHVFIEKPRCSC